MRTFFFRAVNWLVIAGACVALGGGYAYAAKFRFIFPNSANGPVAVDAAGAVYDCTGLGPNGSYGSITKLTPPAAGQSTWGLSYLHSFSFTDGAIPEGVAFLDKSGALYGTTSVGGPGNYGTVFKLTPPAPGQTQWRLTTIASFSGTDGSYPQSQMAIDTKGNLFGATHPGDNLHPGEASVFELSPPVTPDGPWTKQTVHLFSAAEGGVATALVSTNRGTLVGTTGGTLETPSRAYAFELTPPVAGHGAWTETILHVFTSPNFRGITLNTPLIQNKAGDIFGTAEYDSSTETNLVVYRLSPPVTAGAAWDETTLHVFPSSPYAGVYPNSLGINPAGYLFGTTYSGGTFDNGTLFRLAGPKTGTTAWSAHTIFNFTPRQGRPVSLVISSPYGLFGSTLYGKGFYRRDGSVFNYLP